MSGNMVHPLKEERERRGWSQSKVADALKTTVRTISRWERGKALPYPFYREQLCELFGKDAYTLSLVSQQEEISVPPNDLSVQMQAWYAFLDGRLKA